MKIHIDAAHARLLAKRKLKLTNIAAIKHFDINHNQQLRKKEATLFGFAITTFFGLKKSLQTLWWNTTTVFGRFGPLHLQKIQTFVNIWKHMVGNISFSPMSSCQFSFLFKSCGTCFAWNGLDDHGFACVA